MQKCLSRLRSPANSVASHRFTPLRSFRETASGFAGKVLGDLKKKKKRNADKIKEKPRPIKYLCALLEFEYIVSESVIFRRSLFLLILRGSCSSFPLYGDFKTAAVIALKKLLL